MVLDSYKVFVTRQLIGLQMLWWVLLILSNVTHQIIYIL